MLPDRVTSLESQILQLRAEMHDGFSAIDGRFEETHRFMRVLHEEVLTRISLLQEARRPRKS